MENLITENKKNKKMKKTLFMLCTILWSCNVIFSSSKIQDEIIIEICFNDHFNNDKIDLKICNYNIFKGVYLMLLSSSLY